MVQINKDEMKYLAKHGARWQKELHRTYSHQHHYYLTEDPRWMKMLKKYREGQIIYSREG